METKNSTFDGFLDNGVLRNFYRKTHRDTYLSFKDTFDKYVKPPSVHLIATPLQLVEYLGYPRNDNPLRINAQTSKRLSEIASQATDIGPESAFNKMTESIEEQFANDPRLSEAKIREKLAFEDNKLCDEGKAISGILFSENLDRFHATKKRFYWELAVDRLQSLTFDRSLHTKLLLKVNDVLLSSIFNVSFLRALNSWISLNPNSSNILRDLNLENDHDAVDTQFIHLGVVGHKRDNNQYPILIFFREKPTRTIKRLEIYGQFILHNIRFFRNEHGIEIPIKPGKYVCLENDTGKLREEIDVSALLRSLE